MSRSWDALNLPDWCLDAVASLGYASPTAVQTAVLPLFMGNSDVVVEVRETYVVPSLFLLGAPADQ